MPRLMSVAFTEQAVRDRTKTVTRRKGWTFLKPGDRLTLCRKVMGRKPGEPLVRLAEVEVTEVRRELLACLGKCACWDSHQRGTTYSEVEMTREGFPSLDPDEFVRRLFLEAQGMQRGDWVTRIEWRYLDGPACACKSHDPKYHGGTCGHCGQDWDMDCLPDCPVGEIVAARLLAEYGPSSEDFITITITPVEGGDTTP